VRGELLALREQRFVEAARGFGESWWGVLGWHLAGQLRAPLGVVAALLAVEAILAEATLAFLGFGLQPAGGVSWGAMLDAGRQQAHTGAWHLWALPALALVVAALSLHAAVDRRALRAR
jgi:peptide/nickel transport system permease protein